MNRWLNQLERKARGVCIQNLALVLVVGQLMVYLCMAMLPTLNLGLRLSLITPYVLQGEVWRLVTFLFVPISGNVITLVLSLYFLYLVGHALEQTWGDFRFNVYYFIGALGAIAAAFLGGWGTTYYLNLSLFFAFAVLYPNFQVLLFFIIPIKMKYLAALSGAMCLFTVLFGSWAERWAVLFALANFFLFFGGDFIATVRREITYHRTRSNWRNNNRGGW